MDHADHPRLRPLEAFPVEQDGERLIALRDPSGFTEQVVLLPIPALDIVSLFDGEHSVAEIHRVVDNAVLYNLMKLASDADAAQEARAIAWLKLDQLKSYLSSEAATKDDSQRAHCRFAGSQIERYQGDPSRFVFPAPVVPPPGAPIGTIDLPLPWMVWNER